MNQYKIGPWLIAIAALLWAVDAPFRVHLTQDLPSSAIVLMEHILIVILCLPLILPRISELKNLSARHWLAVIFVAWGGSALATVLFTESFRYLNPSVAILLQKTQPFIAILLAVIVLSERLTKRFWAWAAVGVAGAFLVTLPDIQASGWHMSGPMRGMLMALAAAFFWGGSTVFGRYVLSRVSFPVMTSLRFMGALIFLFFLSLYQGTLSAVRMATGKDWLYVAIIAVLAGYISLFIYYRGLSHTRASIATIGELLFPFSAVLVNWYFLDARLAPVQIAGGMVLLVAITFLSLQNIPQAQKAPEFSPHTI